MNAQRTMAFLFSKDLKGEACPVAKAQYQNLISLADLVTVFSDLASSSISATRGSYRHATSEMLGDSIPKEKHLEQKAQCFACSSQYRASNHQIARLSKRSPQYFPFSCAIWNAHFIASI